MMLVREAEPPPKREQMFRDQILRDAAPEVGPTPRALPAAPPTSNPMSSDAAMQRRLEALEGEVQRLREQLAEERSKR